MLLYIFYIYIKSLPKGMLIKGRDGGREGEKYPYERETSIDCLSYAPCPRTEPVTQTCALSRN